jgi:ComF family protein
MGASVAADASKVATDRSLVPRRQRWFEPPLAAAINLLFPPRCVACGAEFEPSGDGPLFCAACDGQLAVAPRPTCPRCALACSDADLPRGDCGDCRSRKLLFQASRTIAPYRNELRHAVLKAKHVAHEPLAIALGQRLAEAVVRMPFSPWPDLVVPVPMHWLKRIWRKTNPAGTMAQAVARQLQLPCANGALICRRFLRRQATLTPAERRRNVRGAFQASSRWKLAGKHVLLVDDVMTTGATAHEASRALLQAGAATIYVATVARSSPDF